MENLGITKEQSGKLIEEHVKEPNTKLHLLESEAIMQALAKKLGEDEESWGIIGLLHDIDWDLTKNDNANHCVKCREILQQAGGTEFLIETIQSHGYGMKEIPALEEKQRTTKIQHCLVAAETLTGLIIASTLINPDKKLASLQLSSLKKRFKNKGFSAKCNRELILECEQVGVPLDEFLEIGLTALQGISDKLGF